MALQIKRPRGRPLKKVPVFSDPNAEAVRVNKRLAAGLTPYPPFKHVPCHAEKSLRKDASPYIPFNLVLDLNNYDHDGRHLLLPKGKKSLDEAYQKRLEAARNGAAERPRSSLAAEMIRSERVYIQGKLDGGWSKSKIFRYVKIRRDKAGKKCACRTEFYKQLAALGLKR
jgi:hypothetical protein